MRKRTLYTLLFALPGLVAAVILAALAVGAAAGALWLFVYGDAPWPAVTGTLLPLLGALVFTGAWGGALAWGYAVGRRLEAVPGLDRRHLWLAAGVTLGLLLFVALQQLRVGHLGAKPESLVCSDFCRAQGFAVSELSPRDAGARSCSCLDGFGRPALSTPFAELTRDAAEHPERRP